MLRRLFPTLLFILTLFVTIQPDKAYACSGFPYFGVSDLPTMDLLVRATVVEADDAGHNAILRVEDYYKGEGPPFITVMRYPPALTSGALMRGYDTGCLYSGRGHRWQQGSQGYFGLRPNGDGTFTDENGGTAHFYVVDGVITYEEGATEGYAAEFDEPLTISEEDFVAEMLRVGGRDAPMPPTSDGIDFYPLHRFLTLTTQNGTRYQINPDRSVTPLSEDAPLDISPDGAHVAFRLDDEQILFRYIWTEFDPETIGPPGEGQSTEYQIVPGQFVRFSYDSNLVAVWDDTQLAVYMLHNHEEADYAYGASLGILQVAQVNLTTDAAASSPTILWSGDGTTLVWEDSSGVWRWDLFSMAEAQQLYTAAEVDALDDDQPAALLDVSTYGRYVRVGTDEHWELMDSDTMEAHPQAFAAPTEQFLLLVSSDASEQSDLNTCTPPLRDNCTVYSPYVASETFVYHNTLLGLLRCDDEGCIVTASSWHAAVGATGYIGGVYLAEAFPNARQVIYDAQHQQPALLVGDYNIRFDFYPDYYFEEEDFLRYLDYVDLEGIVDSPIVSIEWGQAIFYDAYLLSTTAYAPQP